MEYLLMIADNEQTVAEASPAQINALLERHRQFSDELHAAGAWVSSQRLRPSSDAATVRRPGDKVVVVDGPFAESKEVLGGFYLIEAASMEEALGWAKKLPTLKDSAIEVRPVWGTTRTRRWRET
jgi:hypothetical protein